MENRVLQFNTGIAHISINKYGDELLLNTADTTVFNKFAKMYGNVQQVAEDAEKEISELKKKHVQADTNETDAIVEIANANTKHIERILEELDKVFGQGFIRKVYRENYELDADFVPDEFSIMELIDALIPILEDAYGERIKRAKSKYSAAKRGKHNKTKEELLA